MRIPEANDVVAVFIKFHFQTEWVIGAAGKAVIALVFQTKIWILDLFHLYRIVRFSPKISIFLRIAIGKKRKWDKTKKESNIADELFFVTPTGFKPVTF